MVHPPAPRGQLRTWGSRRARGDRAPRVSRSTPSADRLPGGPPGREREGDPVGYALFVTFPPVPPLPHHSEMITAVPEPASAGPSSRDFSVAGLLVSYGQDGADRRTSRPGPIPSTPGRHRVVPSWRTPGRTLEFASRSTRFSGYSEWRSGGRLFGIRLPLNSTRRQGASICFCGAGHMTLSRFRATPLNTAGGNRGAPRKVRDSSSRCGSGPVARRGWTSDVGRPPRPRSVGTTWRAFRGGSDRSGLPAGAATRHARVRHRSWVFFRPTLGLAVPFWPGCAGPPASAPRARSTSPSPSRRCRDPRGICGCRPPTSLSATSRPRLVPKGQRAPALPLAAEPAWAWLGGAARGLGCGFATLRSSSTAV